MKSTNICTIEIEMEIYKIVLKNQTRDMNFYVKKQDKKTQSK